MHNYETAFWDSEIADNEPFEKWEAAGSEDAAIRANRRWKKALAEYEAPPLDEAIDEALKDFMARRKAVDARMHGTDADRSGEPAVTRSADCRGSLAVDGCGIGRRAERGGAAVLPSSRGWNSSSRRARRFIDPARKVLLNQNDEIRQGGEEGCLDPALPFNDTDYDRPRCCAR